MGFGQVRWLIKKGLDGERVSAEADASSLRGEQDRGVLLTDSSYYVAVSG